MEVVRICKMPITSALVKNVATVVSVLGSAKSWGGGGGPDHLNDYHIPESPCSIAIVGWFVGLEAR
jgi:hypothetical protein